MKYLTVEIIDKSESSFLLRFDTDPSDQGVFDLQANSQEVGHLLGCDSSTLMKRDRFRFYIRADRIDGVLKLSIKAEKITPDDSPI